MEKIIDLGSKESIDDFFKRFSEQKRTTKFKRSMTKLYIDTTKKNNALNRFKMRK